MRLLQGVVEGKGFIVHMKERTARGISLNWSMRRVGRKERERKKRERGRGEGKRMKRGPGAKLASYVGVREAGEEK